MRFLFFILITLLAASSVAAQTSRTARTDVEPEIRKVIRERLDAYGRADAIGWSRFVADDCLCGPATKAELQREISVRPSSAKTWYGDIADLQVRIYGDVVIARYRVTDGCPLSATRAGPRRKENKIDGLTHFVSTTLTEL